LVELLTNTFEGFAVVALQIESQVGDDGVLALHVPLGAAEARSRVLVTISPFPASPTASDPSDWHDFVKRTYGSCADLGLEEPEDLQLSEGDYQA
jgi:hypothetical protein